MPGRGVHFAFDRPTLDALIQAPDPAVRLRLLEQLEEAWDEAWLCETDKAWATIDLALAGDPRRFPHSVLGARELDVGPTLRAGLLTPRETAATDQALRGLGPAEFSALYRTIDPAAYGRALTAEELAYTWPWFLALRRFLHRAATDHRAVVFTVDE